MQKCVLALALCALVLSAGPLQAQEGREDISLASLTKYYIAVFSKGPAWSEEQVKATMQKNREQIRKLVADGKIVGAAMSQGDGDVRSLFFLKTSKQAEAEELVKNAPSVKAGLLTGSVHEVWGTKGMGSGLKETMKDPEKKLAQEKMYLVVYSKGPEWSAKEDEATRAKIADSYKSINRLWKSGTLRFFAAVADTKKDVRALGIFASSSTDEAMTVASDDPGVKGKWFTVKVFPVTVAEGVLP